ncbi:MAG: hypothetical protein J6Q87_01480 [Clostridia bacterium]|jgi:hypothetical protein|nr:hypothetical protein [Clostridia bacterium]
MNVFEKMMNDIFSAEDFLETCTIGNLTYKCIVSSVADGVIYAETGLESNEMFTLDVKLPMFKLPEKNDKVKFRGKTWKIADNAIVDSANTSVKFTIIALSKGIG